MRFSVMLILASASPRRIEMLMNAGYDPVVKPASIIEKLPFDMRPETATMYLALAKAEAVFSSVQASIESGLQDWIPDNEGITILAADTVVVLDGKIIGKPFSEEDAFNTLMSMKNRSHHVITGCCVIRSNSGPCETETLSKSCFYDDTEVFFRNYSAAELRAYLKTDEPYDKAGGYAIQGTFGKYVDHIDGDMDNVIGLPLYRVKEYV